MYLLLLLGITISFDFLDYFQMWTLAGALVANINFIVGQFFTA
ncbi:hypothetical protein [Morganella morganii]|nr:hypothetical protein [Morganella morganii]